MAKAQKWTVWTIRPAKEPGKKPSKVPVANITDPSTWSFYPTARSCLDDEKIAGLGFMMYGRPGVIGVDIDNCIGDLGERGPTATQFLAILEAHKTKCHVEISPSGKGLRVFAAETPTPFHDFTNKDTGVECYTGESPRYLCFTGAILPEFSEVGGPFDPLPDEAVIWLGKHASKWKEGAQPEAAKAEATAEPVPELSRRDDWKDLYPKVIKRLSKDHKQFLDTGALGDRYSSASEHLFAVEQSLLKLGLKPAQAYQVLISAEGSWGVALEHREGKTEKAKAFVWDDLQRAATSKEKHEKDKAIQSAGWKDCDIVVEMTEDGAKAKWLALNVLNAFKKHPEWINRLGYNTFDGRVTLDKQNVESEQLITMSAWIVDFLKWSSEFKREAFEEALAAAAKARPWNPIEDQLRGLVWDSKKRLKRFVEALVEEPEPVDYEILKKWLVAYVARGIEPGCQMDTVLVLRERVGGGFKTKFCRVMAGSMDRFSDSPGFGSDRESAMLREGMRIVELGEGVAARKADRHELKRDITKLDEQFRRPWGRGVERRPRGFVYVMTVNDFAFLRSDQDGLRRIWPVNAKGVIDIEWIKANLDQLLAEAVTWYEAGTAWWWDKGEEPEALVERQGSAVQEDPLDAAVDVVISDKENIERGYTTLAQIKAQVEGAAGIIIGASQMNHLMEICHKNGLRSGRERRIDGRKLRPWVHDSWKPTVPGKVLEMRTGAPAGEPEEGVA
jgi:predicted P-loop ATPase